MERFLQGVADFSAWLWGIPLITMLLISGLYMTFKLGFFQFRYFSYIVGQTFGSIFRRPKGEGTVTPFQALTSALSSTIGAANIVGVPAAIMFGGPGAIFWMWVIALIGMALKFAESVLAVEYREKNAKGEFVGGPMYYMKKGLNMKWLGIWFSFALMIELIPSIMVQGNSIANTVQATFNVPVLWTGIATAVLVSIVVFGGIKRIGKVTEIFVPFMALIYVGGAVVILLMNITAVPEFFMLIFSNAFSPAPVMGGFAGAAIVEVIRWGFARGLYSNEAGLGTAPIAHAAATTDHPVRQGFWAVIGVVVDTLIVCTATAFVILSSGVWTEEGAMENSSALTSLAFEQYFGDFGAILVTVALIFFVLSTILVVVFYGAKQAEFLFGTKASYGMQVVYIFAVILGAVGAAEVIWGFLDIMLAAILIPNILAVLLLSNKVKELKDEFFTSDEYYRKDLKVKKRAKRQKAVREGYES
ncbi:sodium:alanine symporter family protein [Planococcus sp. CP5-4]|uniref:alanine/glycine:cation symporter family protein n=1 Tax=unclassified Planococcus (in: firmicutes) TaxID=2662419 RepID=UPI001C24F892|nr:MULTISPECIES: sodium:alanine symporter family protein [unclassified Planococcus (in: firmicutes)]MBU9673910.1 sodium:alanine symporter family protein [Planococcus sp. CP5-4_YE]MBV0909780.1 sodium:alanine symporter family protein [Planococcus sp. CP5-4_UN]MBW6065264.1 sodium:alanine symporter family protein [Planococcus sp. CP5-4]